jgi:hypothetical protein
MRFRLYREHGALNSVPIFNAFEQGVKSLGHEIVNDMVGGEPLMVSFCPLCNTASAFKSTFDGQALDFGTTGRLRYSNLIMYDRQTESWWQQAGGDGLQRRASPQAKGLNARSRGGAGASASAGATVFRVQDLAFAHVPVLIHH